MIHGRLRPCNRAELERLNDAAWRVNENLGMKVHSETILGFCEQAGAVVDHQAQVARFPRALIEQLLPEPFAQEAERVAADGGSVDYIDTGERPSDAPEQPGVAVAAEFGVGYGEVTFFLHEWETGTRREVDREGLAELVRLGDAIPEVTHIATPVTPTDVPAIIESLESTVVMMRNTAKRCGGGIRMPQQVDYFIEISRIYESYTGQRDYHIQRGGCLTTPMTLGDRTAGIVDRLIHHGYRQFRFSSMPIAGGNAPVTVAGCATMCVAELMGGWLVARCIDPEAGPPASVISGSMDMMTGKACFSSPEAVLQDAIACQFFADVYGGTVGVDSDASYIEANMPGIEAAYERLIKQQGLGVLAGRLALHLGSLDGAAIFSREQAMLDLDVCRALHRLYSGPDLAPELMAVEEIERIGHDPGSAYFESPHTLAHFREMYVPDVLRRETWNSQQPERTGDEAILRRANAKWRALLADHEPTCHNPEMVDEIEKVVRSAREHLVG